MILVPIIASALLGVTPPPPVPVVHLLQVVASDVGDDLRGRSDALLTSLVDGGYIGLAGSDLGPADFAACLDAPDHVATCASDRLTSLGVGPGVVVLVLERTDVGLQWTCVGRDMNPFTPDRQVFRLGGADEDASDIRDRAAACLTYAGHQSGW